ncbi:hypothetical protein ONZ45_g14314 [Pleurotus djamor]|nr:hypothetical protein ONZ45_g14314 [Pleurotus djamor]
MASYEADATELLETYDFLMKFIVIVLVGNKADREDEREVEWAEASKWAADNDVHFLEASSLTGDNVEAPFLLVARAILLAIESGTLDPEKAGSGPPKLWEFEWTAEEGSGSPKDKELDTGIEVLLMFVSRTAFLAFSTTFLYRGMSSTPANSATDEVSIPASDSVPADSSSPSSAEESSSSSLSMSQRPSSTGSFEPGPSPSPPVKNPAANPPKEETKPESLSSSKAPGSTPAPNPPPAPESSQRSSSQSPPAQPSSSRAPPPPPASTPRTRSAERPQSSVAPSSASQDAPPPSSTSVQASTTPRVVGAIGQTSSTQTRSTITRTITDVPDSTFSQPMSITVTDPTNGQTSVSAPPFVTVLSTSTEPDGAVETFTHIIANPTDIGASTALGNQSVLSNRGAAAGIFISVGIAAAAITAVIFFLCRRRRRRLRRERWLTGIHRPVPPPDPFDDPPMASVNVLADDITRSTNGRNLLDDELRSSVSSSRPMISQPQPTLSSGAAGRGAHGQGIINPFDSNQASHPHTNIGLAITSDHYTDLQRQSRVSLAPSTPSIYPASLAPSDRDLC